MARRIETGYGRAVLQNHAGTRKPMPEATCAATRVGSPLLPPATAISLTSTNRWIPMPPARWCGCRRFGRATGVRAYQCAQCRAKHDAYGAVENNGQRKRGEHEDSLLKKGVRNFPHTLQRQPASRNCVAAFGWFELRAVSGPRPYDGSAGGPGFSAYGGRRHGSY